MTQHLCGKCLNTLYHVCGCALRPTTRNPLRSLLNPIIPCLWLCASLNHTQPAPRFAKPYHTMFAGIIISVQSKRPAHADLLNVLTKCHTLYYLAWHHNCQTRQQDPLLISSRSCIIAGCEGHLGDIKLILKQGMEQLDQILARRHLLNHHKAAFRIGLGKLGINRQARHGV